MIKNVHSAIFGLECKKFSKDALLEVGLKNDKVARENQSINQTDCFKSTFLSHLRLLVFNRYSILIRKAFKEPEFHII